MKSFFQWHISLRASLFIVALIISGIGCKSKKIIQHTGPVPERTSTEIYQAMEDHNFPFEWYACETGINLDTPDESVGGKAYIRMKKDSIIWSVVKKLSMEGARTLITPKRYAAINRTNHTYQKGSTEDAMSSLGISLIFADLQEAIFGNIILLDSTSAQIEKEGEHYIVKGIDDDLQLKYWINAYTMEVDRALMIDYLGRRMDASYSDYRILDSGQKVPFFRHYNMPFDDRGNAEIVLKIKKIEIDVPKKTRFSIPHYYEKI